MNQYEKYKTASQSTSSTYKLIIIFDNIIKILNNTKKAAEKNDILGKIDGFNKVIDIFNVLRNSFNDEAQRYPLIKVLIKFNNLAVEKAAELNTKEYSAIETDKFINSVASIRNTLIEGEKKGKFL